MSKNINNYKRILITFEGLDGCGKTTAMNGAYEVLGPKYNNRIVTMRDPGTTEIAEKIRTILLYSKEIRNKWTEYYLYLAARAELVKEIRSNLEQGKIIFLDRFFDSTFAFQGFRNGIPLEVISEDNRRISEGIVPDLTLLYKITPEIATARNKSNGKKSRIDIESIEQHRKVYEGYEWVAKKFHRRVRIIDASQSKEKVLMDTVKILDEFLANILNPD